MSETISQAQEKRLYRFFVPYVNIHGQTIPKERREDFINVFQTEACRKNGGYTSFEAGGGYMSDAGQIIREAITVIETYGDNPLPPERISHCSNYLAQESLIVMSVGSYEFMDYRGKVDIRRYKLPAEK
jgi:hypothetical protein